MKLLKLVYLAHGWNLAITGKGLITEVTQAWKYGPVIPTIYRAFKYYGTSNISALASGGNPISEIDENTTKVLDKVWDVYKDFTGLQLSTLTHQSGSPWDIIWNQENGKDSFDVPIPNKVIENYYKAKGNKNNATAATHV